MYFHEYFNVFHNWTEIIFLAPELKAEPQGKATIAITTQYEVQRITTSKNKLQLIVTNPNRLTVYVRRSLWFTVAPREFWTFQSIRSAPMNSLRWATIPFSKVEWTATNNNILGDFCHESGFLAVRQKVVTVWPRLYKPGLIWAMTMAQNSLIQQRSSLLTGNLRQTSWCAISGNILGMGSANERRRFIITPPLIGWVHTQNDPCIAICFMGSLPQGDFIES